jgi:hypothetical protein
MSRKVVPRGALVSHRSQELAKQKCRLIKEPWGLIKRLEAHQEAVEAHHLHNVLLPGQVKKRATSKVYFL